jgi:hypothetical protein
MQRGFSTNSQTWNPDFLQMNYDLVYTAMTAYWHVRTSSVAQSMSSMQPFKMERKFQKWNPQARLGLPLLWIFRPTLFSSAPSVKRWKRTHLFTVQCNFWWQIWNRPFIALHQPFDQQWAKIFSLGQECFTNMDHNENDQPIVLPPLSDIIRTFREERTRQPWPELIILVDCDTNFDDWYGNNQNATLDQNQPTNKGQKQHIPNDDIPVPGGAINKMTQADPFHAMNITGGEPTTIWTEADIPFLHPIPIPGGDPNTIPTGEIINENENQGDNNLTSSGRPCQNVGTYKDGPIITRHLPFDDESYELAYNATLSNVCLHPIPAISNQGHFNDYQPQ